jgi:folate-dependent phosphoribosylglycinamide formyltransferase PurN
VAAARLRIALCTRGGLPGTAVLRTLLSSPRVEVAIIVRSTRMFRRHQGYVAAALQCLRHSGPAYASYLRAATTWGGFEACARSHGIALVATGDVNEREACARIASAAPDLLVSAFFNQRIGEAVAQLAPLGAVNIHPSPLPKERGVDPVFRARLRGDPMLGVSVHRISPEWDAGPLLRREELAARDGESVLAATTRLYARGAELLLDALDDVVARLPGTPQVDGGTYDSWPTRAEVVAAARRGIRLARGSDRRSAAP